MNLIDKDKLLEALAEAQKQPCVSLRKLIEEQKVYETFDVQTSYSVAKEILAKMPEIDIVNRIEQFFSNQLSDYLLWHGFVRRSREVRKDAFMKELIEFTGSVTVVVPEEDEHDRT